jgi:hypothetical protein
MNLKWKFASAFVAVVAMIVGGYLTFEDNNLRPKATESPVKEPTSSTSLDEVTETAPKDKMPDPTEHVPEKYKNKKRPWGYRGIPRIELDPEWIKLNRPKKFKTLRTRDITGKRGYISFGEELRYNQIILTAASIEIFMPVGDKAIEVRNANKDNSEKTLTIPPDSIFFVFLDSSKNPVATFVLADATYYRAIDFALARLDPSRSQPTLILTATVFGGGRDADSLLFDFSNEGKPSVGIEFVSGDGRYDDDYVRGATNDLYAIAGDMQVTDQSPEIFKFFGGKSGLLLLPRIVPRSFQFGSIFRDEFMTTELAYAILQMDGSHFEVAPHKKEFFMYRILARDDGRWTDVSRNPVGKAFFRAMEKDLLRVMKEYSNPEDGETYEGALLNWHLVTWASTKSILGEWRDAVNRIREMHDATIFTSQFCENHKEVMHQRKLYDAEPPPGGKDPKNCKSVEFVDFVESEMKVRGFQTER